MLLLFPCAGVTAASAVDAADESRELLRRAKGRLGGDSGSSGCFNLTADDDCRMIDGVRLLLWKTEAGLALLHVRFFEIKGITHRAQMTAALVRRAMSILFDAWVWLARHHLHSRCSYQLPPHRIHIYA